MSEKKVFYTLIFFFLASLGLLSPVVAPYFTLEKNQIDQVNLDLITNPEGVHDFTKALVAQTNRNVDRLERAQSFGKWFVLGFTIFVISSFLLFGFLIRYFLNRVYQSQGQRRAKLKGEQIEMDQD